MTRFLGKNPLKKHVRQFPNNYAKHVIQPKENKKDKTDKEMTSEGLEKIESIVGAKAPKRKVKVEKKAKGLIERTENSTILITEDDRMVLHD